MIDNSKKKAIIKVVIYVALFVILLTADLLSKQLVCAITRDGENITVIENVLVFTYSENTGASFGMFGESTLLLTIFTSIVCVGMVVFLFWKRRSHPVLQVGLIVMLAGALGNLYDRIAFGYVRDFIDYKFLEALFNKPFAICNVADFVLIVGAIIMIVYVLFFYDKQFKKEKPIAADGVTSEDVLDVSNEKDSQRENDVTSGDSNHEIGTDTSVNDTIDKDNDIMQNNIGESDTTEDK